MEQGPEPVTGAEWDMSAPISADDILKAGGLGARDDIGSVVPVAADNTDLEETLMEYGASQTSHEGVGYHCENGGGASGSAVPEGGSESVQRESMAVDPDYLANHFTRPVQDPTE